MDKVKITLVKSIIGATKRQKRTVEALGLKKLNSCVEQQNTPVINGMVKKVQHLVKVEKIG